MIKHSCDICGQDCAYKLGDVRFSPMFCINDDIFEVCESCLKDVRKRSKGVRNNGF